ncbi:MAG: hypothetical protein AAFZ99_14925 [Pseudomonadota bacterium]
MNRKSPLRICPKKAAGLYRNTVSFRRAYVPDGKFFKASDFWRDAAADIPEVRIKLHDRSILKASTNALDELTVLVAPKQLFDNADRGCKICNFILAHEAGHISEEHHSENAVSKYFQLFATETEVANIPPTIEELETNYAATFFLCGPAIFDLRRDALRLADVAYCDVYYIKKVRKLLEQQEFWEEMQKLNSTPRAVF